MIDGPKPAATLRLVWPLLGRHLGRLVAVVLLGVGASVSLGLMYPVERHLDTASWSLAEFNSTADFLLAAEDEAEVSASLGRESCLITGWATRLTRGGRTASRLELLGVNASCDQRLTPYPPAARVAFSPVPGPDWVDLSADAAAELRAAPGDVVDAFAGDDRPPVRLTVRGVYAVRPGLPNGAITSAEVLFANASEESLFFSELFSADDPARLSERIGTGPLARLSSPKSPLQVRSRAELLEHAEDNSSASIGLIRVVSTLALVSGIGVAVRELDVFRRHLTKAASLIHRLGGDVRRIMREWTIAALVAACLAGAGGVLAGLIPYVLGILAPALPWQVVLAALPLLLGALALALAAGAISYRLSVRRLIR